MTGGAHILHAFTGKWGVFRAILLREVRVRFAGRRLGYLWAVLEPLIHVALYVVIFLLLGRASPVEQPLPIFFASSILPWLLFTGTINRVTRAPDANKALLIYPHISPIDFMLVRMVLESVTYATVLMIMVAIAYAVSDYHIIDPLPMIGAWLAITMLAGGIGMINAVIMDIVDTYDNFFKPAMRLVYFTSGIFFIVSDLPMSVQHALAWNPMLHLIDLFRGGALPGYHAGFFQPVPILAAAAAFFLTGMMLERLRRKELRTP